jgi:hypothetical protein
MHNDPQIDDSPTDRSLIAKIAAHERWAATTDRTAATAPARQGLRRKFAAEVDPEGLLPNGELERRVDQRMHAHMLRMALASKRARQARRNGEEIMKAFKAPTAGRAPDPETSRHLVGTEG